MTPNQKMVGENGLQNALFPLQTLSCSRGSHKGDDYAYDFVGYIDGVKTPDCPMYAPFDCKVVYKGKSSEKEPTIVWQSIEKVNFVNGEIDYMCVSVSHDDNWQSYNIGDTRKQGEHFANTGETGYSFGDHTHMICGKGKFDNFYITPNGAYTLKNQYDMPLCLGVNDTVIRNTGGFTWRKFTPYIPPEPPTPKKDIMPLSLCGVLKWSV